MSNRGFGEVTVKTIADPRPNVVARKGLGKGGGGNGAITTPHQPQEMPNTLRSRAIVRMLELLSEGPVYGLEPQGTGQSIWQSVYLDGTPVADLANNFNFDIREGDFRYGLPGQAHMPGYSFSESEVTVGVECRPFDPVVRSLELPVSAVRYKVRVPALYENESDGDVVQASVAYAFDISINGGPWTNAVTEQIVGKTVSPYERAVHVYIPGGETATTVDIRVERIQPAGSSSIANTLIFQGFTQILYDHMAYDMSCMIGQSYNAEEFQSVPQRSYLLRGLMMDIPSNYNGLTHGYSGDWDGLFYTQWTNNPAWVLYALLTNTRWGLGDFIEQGAIDKWSFYEAAVFNDAFMANFGEVRYTCNVVINTRQDAYTLLQAVASSMLAQLYYSNGTVFLVQDRYLNDPIRLFTPSDVVSGLFDYSSADVRSRYNAVPVQWNDPSDDYKPAVELVQDHTLVSSKGYKEAPMQYMFGCTSKGQAIRWGRWFIYTNNFETEVVTFRTGLENADIRPGDLIAVMDPSRVGARTGGRIIDGSTIGELVLDKLSAEMIAGISTFSLYVTIGSAAVPDGTPPTVVSLTLLAVLDADEGRVSVSGMAAPIEAGSMWIARGGGYEPSRWRVAGISDRDGIYEITATEYHIEKWSYIERGVLIPPPPFSLIPTGALQSPSNLTFSEFIYRDTAGAVQFGIVLSWSASNDPRVQRYQVELSGPSGDYRRFSQISGVAQEVLSMRSGQWAAVLTAFDNIGRRTAPVTLTFIPVGLSALPLPPSALYVAPQGNMVSVTWVPTGEIDVAYYWLKWSPAIDSSGTWLRATTSIARVAHDITEVTTPLRSGTFMLKAIDSLGQESEEWAEAVLIPQRTERVHIIDVTEEPDWLGDRGANWHQNVDELWVPSPDEPEVVPAGVFPGDRAVALNKTPTRIAVYDFANSVDLGIVTAGVSLVAMIDAYGAFFGVVMADWETLADVDPLASGGGNAMSTWRPLAMTVPLAMGASAEFDVHIEVRIAQEDGVTFGDWRPLKAEITTGRVFEFRMVGSIYDLVTTARVAHAEVVVEVPLRNVQGDDVALNVSTGSLTVTYPIPFMATPTVQITARQGISPGGNIVITASTATYFSVQHQNSSGVSVGGGSIDYFVQGYGGHAG